jgi:hypothetical protein
MEQVLVADFKRLRAVRIRIRPTWFKARALALMLEMYPDEGILTVYNIS